MLPLTLEDVSFAAGGRTIIDRVSCEFTPGPRTVILGPNGAGKSVLMRLCHGLLTPTAGRIAWRGRQDERRPRAQAMVFQRPVMLRRAALGNVTYGLKLAGVARTERDRRAREVLDAVGLSAIATRPARVLSGGEQQKLALARAWALTPEVLFLDCRREPDQAQHARSSARRRDPCERDQDRHDRIISPGARLNLTDEIPVHQRRSHSGSCARRALLCAAVDNGSGRLSFIKGVAMELKRIGVRVACLLLAFGCASEHRRAAVHPRWLRQRVDGAVRVVRPHPAGVRAQHRNPKLRVVALGTGERWIARREEAADVVVFVHAGGRGEFLREGHGVQRFPIMYNDFVVVGPNGSAGTRGDAARRRIPQDQECRAVRLAWRPQRHASPRSTSGRWPASTSRRKRPVVSRDGPDGARAEGRR